MAIKDWPGGVISKTPVAPTSSGASGVWTLDQVAYWAKQGAWPYGLSDPYYEYVSLLLTGNGANGAQNNTFLDSSTNNFTITRSGNTTQGTFSPYGNLWSNYFGTNNYLTYTTSSISGACTIEAWVNFTAMSPSSGSPYFIFGYAINANPNMNLRVKAATTIAIDNGLTGFDFTVPTMTTGVWYHVVFVRNSSNVATIFVNGVRSSTGTQVVSSFDMTYTNAIGRHTDSSGSYYFPGYISNARIVNGSNVYDPTQSTITVPTSPLTAVSGTLLLTCQSNRFKDNSSNNFTLTVNGNTSVQRFSPFNPTAPYSAATIGGSGYFDGTGDYLSSPSSSALGLGTSNFCVEFWFNSANISQPATQRLTGNDNPWGSNKWTIGVSGGNLFVQIYNFTTTSATISTSTNVLTAQFNHIVLSRSGSNFGLFVNGVRVGTYTSSGSMDGGGSQIINIGARASGELIAGYIGDYRLVIGSYVYDPTQSTLTVPTAPLTAISGTSLLCNFTNAGIPDAAMQNDLETVGNAQVSTSVKKYGTGSLAFDGTGDYLISNSATTDLYAFSLGDFTIEFWLYSNNSGVQQILYDGRASGTNGNYVTLYKSSANVLELYVNSGVRITGTTAIAATTWYHVALCRSGTSTRLFLNGVQQGSTYSDSTNYLNGANRPVIGADSATLGNLPLNGYIDDLRVTKGYARYTTTFTPPTAAFPTF